MKASINVVFILCNIPLFSLVLKPVFSSSQQCSIQHVGSGGLEVHLDCHHKNMTQVPTIKSLGLDTGPDVTSIDLSWNNVTKLLNHSFCDFPNLRILNLSHAGIQSIADHAFSGLFNLQILDLTNNFVTREQGLTLHAETFKDCLALRKLILTNVQLSSFAALENLQKLQELTMTPNDYTMPYNLKNLPHLRVIYFAFCDFLNRTLTKQLIRPLAEFIVLEELAFHSCNIRWLDHGIFEGFSKLVLLNFAQNEELPSENVLQVLSSDSAPQIKSLIIDSDGGPKLQPNPLLLQAKNGCLSVWTHLENVAMCNTQLFGITSNFVDCMPNMKSIALGFNLFFTCGIRGECSETLTRLFWNIHSIDASYGQARDNGQLRKLEGYASAMGWVPNNEDYFPQVLDTNVSCDLNQSKTFIFPEISRESLRRVSIPPCLSYIRIDHFVLLGSHDISECLILSENQITFLDMSNRYGVGNISISSEIHGLQNLEIFDASNFGLVCMARQSMQDLSSLRILRLDNNYLGGCKNILEVPPIPLIELHLAKNYIEKLVVNELKSLRYLDLSNNKLTNISFLNPNLRTLRILNVANNKLTQIQPMYTDLLDHLFQNRSDFELIINGNPIQCQCDQLDFIRWIQETPINIKNRMQIQCETSSGLMNIMQIDSGKLLDECTHISKKHFKIIIPSIVIGIIVLLTLTFSLLYRYRWHIRWKYYKILYNRKVERGDLILNELANESAFCTYLIFPEGYGEVQNWVMDILYKKLKEDWGRSVYLPRNHDMMGDTEMNNIVGGILQSSTALWVICSEFLEDNLCEIAAHFAFQHLRASQNLLIIYEHVDETRLHLLNPKLGIPHARYTSDEAGLSLFWAKVEQFVPVLQVRN